MPFSVHIWGIEFSIMQGSSVGWVDRGTLVDDLYGRKELISYLTVRSEIFIQSYAARMDWPVEKVGVLFLPPGII